MLTQDDLKRIRTVIKDEIETVEKRLTKKIEMVDVKVEAVHTFNKKAHTEIMAALAESNEINGKEIKKLDKRLTAIETERQVGKN